MSTAKIKWSGSVELESVQVNVETNSIEVDGTSRDAKEYTLDNPISGTIYGTLLNFQGSLESLEDAVYEYPYHSPPVAPVLYIKPANTFNRNCAGIPMPQDVTKLEMGASLGIVMSKTAIALTEENALRHVAGFTIVNDVSVPHSNIFRPAVQHKSRDGFCPSGPWIIDLDEVENPDDLAIRVFINDELKQENSTKNLIRPIAQLLAAVTEFMTLFPGDVLLAGVPEVAPLAGVGDTVRIEIDGIGCLENTVVDEKTFIRRESK
ncbi:fumarylacetoacetate hydrolase family protein [Paenisporosarcina indica]|uniref:fumarylacetoacetate hydrolase family protein n=1 Tax=Paenisporosarcina indica TaxID=650093 RepID=UPI00094F5999|nr:fumarylacetoacetate hydrolase family protein [Paenisporosarcina indica]